MFILGARNVHLRRIRYEKSAPKSVAPAPKSGARKWSHCADFQSVCHGYEEDWQDYFWSQCLCPVLR